MKRLLPIIILTLCPILISGGSGPGDEPPEMHPEERYFRETHPEAEVSDDKFFARILLRDHIHAINQYDMEIKVLPHQEFPTIKTKDMEYELNIHALVRLRDSNPPKLPLTVKQRARPHKAVEREQNRYDKAVRYLWNIVSPETAETLCLANVEVDEAKYYRMDGTPVKSFVADIFVVIGGKEHNLADWLNADGHSVQGHLSADFGARLP